MSISKKITQGSIMLIMMIVISTFAIMACDSLNIVEEDKSKNVFFNIIEKSTEDINIVRLNHMNENQLSKGLTMENPTILYVSSENKVTNEIVELNQASNIEDVINVKNDYNLILSTDYKDLLDRDLNQMYSYTLPTEPIKSALMPSVSKARFYLKSKGFSDFEIDEMIDNANGDELDLVPLVLRMQSLEEVGNQVSAFPGFLISNAYAQTTDDFIRCGAVAIGADILWALGTSDSKKWSKKAIKKAFKEVAKRALGPIGVAISVVTFSVCLVESTY